MFLIVLVRCFGHNHNLSSYHNGKCVKSTSVSLVKSAAVHTVQVHGCSSAWCCYAEGAHPLQFQSQYFGLNCLGSLPRPLCEKSIPSSRFAFLLLEVLSLAEFYKNSPLHHKAHNSVHMLDTSLPQEVEFDI